jgi:hypothetical protein
MRRAHADLAGLTGGDFLVIIVQNLDLAGCDRKSAGQEQLRRLRIVIRLAQHRKRVKSGIQSPFRFYRNGLWRKVPALTRH